MGGLKGKTAIKILQVAKLEEKNTKLRESQIGCKDHYLVIFLKHGSCYGPQRNGFQLGAIWDPKKLAGNAWRRFWRWVLLACGK